MSREDANKGPLAFFGLDTLGNALETFTSLLPAVAIMVLALGVISYLFNWAGFVTLSTEKYVIAIGIAVAVSFFTLARLRVMNLGPEENEDNEAD